MRLIGRDAELQLVGQRLLDRRLVTLAGPGGIGKTALAREALRRVETSFPLGSRSVDLTRVDAPGAVRETLAGQLGFASWSALLDSPTDQPVLVLFDNCEHVVDEVAASLEELFEACDAPTVLATSRVALELPGETVMVLGPLAVPRPGSVDAPAVELFMERARDAGATLDPSDDVAALCRSLDGVPLALELAATRMRSMTPGEVLARLGDTLDLRDRAGRRRASRHQSLRTAIEWSHRLLDDPERDLFDRLGVFAGPFTADMAHAITEADGDAATTLERLDALVGASMLAADTTSDSTLYRQLVALRAFAREQLDSRGELRLVQERFADHAVAVATGISRQGGSNWDRAAFGRLLALYDNLAAALRWCLANDPEPHRSIRIVATLWGVVHQSHTKEVRSLGEQVLSRWPDAEDAPGWADAVATVATCRHLLGEPEAALELVERGLAGTHGSSFAPVTLRRAAAHATRSTGDLGVALTWFEEAADEARARGLAALAVECDASRAHLLSDLGRDREAAALLAAAREAAGSTSPVAAVWVDTVEGSTLLRSDLDRATQVLTAALATSESLGYLAGITTNLRCLAIARALSDDAEGAARRVIDLLDAMLEQGSTFALRMALEVAAATLAATGSPAVAADLAATALTLPAVSSTDQTVADLLWVDPAGGRVLSARDALRITRSSLQALVDTGHHSRPTSGAPTRGAPTSGAPKSGAPTHGAAHPGALALDSAPEAPRSAAPGSSLRQVGEHWEATFAGRVVTLRDGKGVHDLRRLLAVAGQEVHCLDLVGGGLVQGSTGAVIDAAARRAYEDRVRDLQADLEDAESSNDLARAESARVELDAVIDQLTEAVGLGGRQRHGTGPAERARSTVTQRLRSTIRRIEGVHPELGRHLDASIRTGTFCSYRPEQPLTWDLGPP